MPLKSEIDICWAACRVRPEPRAGPGRGIRLHWREPSNVLPAPTRHAGTCHGLTQALLVEDCSARGYNGTHCKNCVQNEYQGRAMHPTVKAKLRDHFRDSNQRLYQLLGRDFQWDDAVV